MTAAGQPDTEELLDRAGRGDAGPASSCWTGTATGCGGWSPSGWTAAWPPASTPPTSCRRPWPTPPAACATTSATARCRSTPGCGSSPGSGWSRLHRHHIRARRRSVDREEPWACPLPDESVGRLADRLVGQRHQPQPAADPRGAARPGPGRAGPARPARPRGPGDAAPGAAVDRRDRRRPGDQRGGRRGPAPAGPGAAPRICWTTEDPEECHDATTSRRSRTWSPGPTPALADWSRS